MYTYGVSGFLWRGLKPKLPETLFNPKYPALLSLAFFWSVSGSCCSD